MTQVATLLEFPVVVFVFSTTWS